VRAREDERTLGHYLAGPQVVGAWTRCGEEEKRWLGFSSVPSAPSPLQQTRELWRANVELGHSLSSDEHRKGPPSEGEAGPSTLRCWTCTRAMVSLRRRVRKGESDEQATRRCTRQCSRKRNSSSTRASPHLR